jgi:hypothetical protein
VLWFFFLQFKQGVIREYPELFEEGSTQSNEYSSFANFGNKWGWYQSIYGLAKGDVTKFDDVTRLNVHTCLLYLAFEKEKVELEKLQLQKYKK